MNDDDESEDEDFKPDANAIANADQYGDQDDESDSSDTDEDAAAEYDEFANQDNSQKGEDGVELYNENVMPRNKVNPAKLPASKKARGKGRGNRFNYKQHSFFGNAPIENPMPKMPAFTSK
jgi:hypothetical protein